MKSYDEIIEMFNLEDEKVYFSNKGKVSAEEVEIIEDYTWSECSGMLYGSDLEGYIVMKGEKELTNEEYEKFRFTYKDEIESYNESGKKYERDNESYNYINKGINLEGCEVYILYTNYNNNFIDSYNIDIYTIK